MSTSVTHMGAAAAAEKLDAVNHEFLTFGLGEEEFGIPILNVQEIIGYQRPTPVPDQPIWMSGVVNIRGNVIPVVDIRLVFGMGHKDYDATSVIIVTQLGERIIGYAVDQVNDVLSFVEDQIQEPPQVSDQVHNDFLNGFGKADNRLVMLLDMQQLLDGTDVTHLVERNRLADEAQKARHEAEARAASEAERMAATREAEAAPAASEEPDPAAETPGPEAQAAGPEEDTPAGKTQVRSKKHD